MDFAELASRISSLTEYLPGKARVSIALDLTPEEYDSLPFDKNIGVNFIDSNNDWRVSTLSEQKPGVLQLFRHKDIYQSRDFTIYAITIKEVPIPKE